MQGEWKTINVIDVGKTPKGRPTVKGAGERDGYLVGDEVHTVPAVGQTIEARITSSTRGDKTYLWLNEWRLVAQTASAPVHINSPSVAAATPDASLRFISNVVGQAIQAKTISKPEEIKAWAVAAHQVMSEILGEP